MNEEKIIAEEIRAQYREKEDTKLDELLKLDRKVKVPCEIFAYCIGIVGALILGLGMCLAMKVIGNVMALGIVIGVVGLAAVSLTYPLHVRMMKNRKKKYGQKILQLSDEILE